MSSTNINTTPTTATTTTTTPNTTSFYNRTPNYFTNVTRTIQRNQTNINTQNAENVASFYRMSPTTYFTSIANRVNTSVNGNTPGSPGSPPGSNANTPGSNANTPSSNANTPSSNANTPGSHTVNLSLLNPNSIRQNPISNPSSTSGTAPVEIDKNNILQETLLAVEPIPEDPSKTKMINYVKLPYSSNSDNPNFDAKNFFNGKYIQKPGTQVLNKIFGIAPTSKSNP
jgi:hypothetical protein